jgi:3-oxoadipate enol-lactonase
MPLHHLVTGAGPPLVLLHSTAADSRQWNAQRGPLGEQWTVITPDLRGYGASPPARAAYSDVGDVLAVLDHLGIEKAGMVGSSGGGRVALQIASAAPDRVSALLLLCAAADGIEPTGDLVAFAAQEDALLERGDVVGATELNVATWLGPEADLAARAHLYRMQEHAFRVQLAAGENTWLTPYEVDPAVIDAPTTVVYGGHDLQFFQVTARHLAETMPRAELVELPWAGHLPNLERPEETTALIAARMSR